MSSLTTERISLECLCGHTRSDIIGQKDDVNILECSACGLWRVESIDADYKLMYRTGWYHNECQRNIGHIPYSERFSHDYEIAESRLHEIWKYKRSGRLLDIGCSNGAFVYAADEKGFEAKGIDLHYDENWNAYRLQCYQMELDDIQESYDIITMHDVLEHYDTPQNVIAKIADILNDNGLLVIDIPDFTCNNFLLQGINFKHVRPIEHFYMLRWQDIDRMCLKNGLYRIHHYYPIVGKIVLFYIRGSRDGTIISS